MTADTPAARPSAPPSDPRETITDFWHCAKCGGRTSSKKDDGWACRDLNSALASQRAVRARAEQESPQPHEWDALAWCVTSLRNGGSLPSAAQLQWAWDAILRHHNAAHVAQGTATAANRSKP